MDESLKNLISLNKGFTEGEMKKKKDRRANQKTSGVVNAHLTPGPDIFLNAFIHVFSPRAGADNPLEQNFDNNRMAFSLCPYVASFKMISSKSDFIHIFNDFVHVRSPWARAENPLGTNFCCQQKALIKVSKWSHRNLTLYTFLMILYMFEAPGQRQKTPWGQTFVVNRKPLSLDHLLQVSNQSLWILILYTFFYVFPHVPYNGIFSRRLIFAVLSQNHGDYFSQILIFAVGNIRQKNNVDSFPRKS